MRASFDNAGLAKVKIAFEERPQGFRLTVTGHTPRVRLHDRKPVMAPALKAEAIALIMFQFRDKREGVGFHPGRENQ